METQFFRISAVCKKSNRVLGTISVSKAPVNKSEAEEMMSNGLWYVGHQREMSFRVEAVKELPTLD